MKKIIIILTLFSIAIGQGKMILKSGKEIDENILKNLPGYRKKDDSPGLGFVSMGVGIGLFFLGWFIFSQILNALSGVGILLFFIGLGTFASATYYKKFNQVDNA